MASRRMLTAGSPAPSSGRVGALAAALLACGGGGGDPGGTAPDTQPPTVSITTPAAGTTVAGNVEVRATASDDDAVAGVEFRLDGALLAAEVRNAPYRVEWATSGAVNGSHTLTATARDPAGNTASAAPVTVTVSNLPPPPPGSVLVTTTTSGTGTDPDGYVVTAGGVQLPIPASGAVTLIAVPAGTHNVLLSNVSPFCLPVTTTITVTVPSGGEVSAAFEIDCTAPPSGRIVYLESTFSGDGMVIRIASLDGSSDVEVVRNAVSVDWSPDGARLAFIRHAPGLIATLHRIDADGTDEIQLAELPLNASGLDWGPDGTMAFSAIREGSGATSIHDVFLIEADGSNLRPLAAGVAARGAPAFSPDGERIAVSAAGIGEEFSVWVFDKDGSNGERLTSGFRDVAGSWSPDGQRLLFSRQSVNFDPTDIFVMESDGTGIQRLTTDPAFEREPVWDPEGGWIAFASDRQPARAVWIMRADGALAMPLSFTAQRGGQPRWTP